MGSIKIQLNKTIKEEKEITLPYYATDGVCHVYKVFSEHQCIQVFYGIDSTVGIHNASLAFSVKSQEISEEEFKARYCESIERFNDIIYSAKLNTKEEHV